MSEDQKEVIVQKTGVNVAAIIAAIALLIAVVAVLHHFGML